MNVNTLPAQMQGFGAVAGMNTDISVQRKLVRDKMYLFYSFFRFLPALDLREKFLSSVSTSCVCIAMA